MTRQELSEEWRKRVQNLMKREEVNTVRCKNCDYYQPFSNIDGYGNCTASHPTDMAFKDSDYCSFALIKDAE